jgi:hypothetical protein
MIESRPLTHAEFNDLVDNSTDKAFIDDLKLEGTDPYQYFQGIAANGILVDGVPIYCGCVMANHFTDSIMRIGARERYPVTLYKIVKSTVKTWANMFGYVSCKITSTCDEAQLILRWILKMGYEHCSDGIYNLKGN